MELKHQDFPALGLELKHWLFLGLKLAGDQAGANTIALLVLSGLPAQTGAIPLALRDPSLVAADLGNSYCPKSHEPISCNK